MTDDAEAAAHVGHVLVVAHHRDRQVGRGGDHALGHGPGQMRPLPVVEHRTQAELGPVNGLDRHENRYADMLRALSGCAGASRSSRRRPTSVARSAAPARRSRAAQIRGAGGSRKDARRLRAPRRRGEAEWRRQRGASRSSSAMLGSRAPRRRGEAERRRQHVSQRSRRCGRSVPAQQRSAAGSTDVEDVGRVHGLLEVVERVPAGQDAPVDQAARVLLGGHEQLDRLARARAPRTPA